MKNPEYVKLAIKIADKIFKVIKKEFLSDGKEKKNNGKDAGWYSKSSFRDNNCGNNWRKEKEMTDLIEELLQEAEEDEKRLHLAHVDLMLSELKRIELEVSSNFMQAEEEKQIIDDWAISKNVKLQEKSDRIVNQLKLFMQLQGEEVKTIDLPNGKLLKRKTPDKIEIVDLEKFLTNADKSMVTLQPEIVKPNLNKIKAYYKMTLKLPIGTKLIEGEEKFNIKLNEVKSGKEEVGIRAEQANTYRDVVW